MESWIEKKQLHASIVLVGNVDVGICFALVDADWW